MGFYFIAGVVIVIISFVVSIEVFAGSFLPNVSDFNDSYRYSEDRIVDMLQTHINVTSHTITGLGPEDYNLNLTVKNNGSITLDASEFTVLIDGISYPYNCMHTFLFPNRVTYFIFTNLPRNGGGEKSAKVVAQNGVSDYYSYMVL